MINYHFDIGKVFPARYPIPGPAPIALLDEFLSQHGSRYGVKLEDS